MPWTHGLLLFVAVVLFALPQTALLPLIDRDEPRFAEAGREMRESGDIVVPTVNHAPRYNKPPMIYWGEAISYSIFGENAFAARLPSVLATAGTALLLFLWGAELGDRRIGLIAGVCYAFSWQVMLQGRVATADGLLIFFMTLTFFAGWKLLLLGRRLHELGDVTSGLVGRNFGWGLALAIGFAGGFLAKGPEAFLPLLPLLICARGNGFGAYVDLVANFLIGLILMLFWGIPAYLQSHGEYLRFGMTEGLTHRMVTGMQGHGAPNVLLYFGTLPFYLLTFWISALPWAPLLILRRRQLFSGWKADRLDTYLLLNVALVFLIFSLMVTKLPHYTLPVFPLIALFFARRWIAAGLPCGLPVKLTGGLALVVALACLISIPLFRAHGLNPSPVGELVQKAGGALTPETDFGFVDFHESNGIWEMRRVSHHLAHTLDEAEVIPFLDQPGPHAVILTTTCWQKLAADAPPGTVTFQAQGLNCGKFGFVDLTLAIKP